MAVSNDKAVESLNYLIGTLHDGEKGYRDAADEVDNTQFKTVFNRVAQERASFRADLEQEVRRHGGEPQEGGSAGAALHRTWINVRDAISGKTDEDVLDEVERGDETAIENYNDVLQRDLPGDLAPTVRQQHDKIQETLQEIRTLKRV